MCPFGTAFFLLKKIRDKVIESKAGYWSSAIPIFSPPFASLEDTANVHGEYLYFVPCSSSYSNSFKQLKLRAGQRNIITTGSNIASCNEPFMQIELKMALHVISYLLLDLMDRIIK